MLKLKDPSLFKQQCYLNGTWVDGAETTAVTNPATGAVIDTIPAATKEDVDRCVAEARLAQKEWAKVPLHKRGAPFLF